MKKKGSFLKIFVTIFICIVLAGFGALGYYLHQQAESGVFFDDTTINGYNVSGQSCKQVMLVLERDYSAPTITVTEQEEEALHLTLEQAGYKIDESALLSNIQRCMTDQKTDLSKLIFSLMEGNTYEVDVPFAYNDDTFKEHVAISALAKPRVSSEDATMEYDKKKKEYYIEPEVYGNEFDESTLQKIVKEAAENIVAQKRPAADATVAIPDTAYYQPKVTSGDIPMNTTINIYNNYCKNEIIYTFGKTKEVLDWDTIQNWIVIDNGEGILLRESIQNYVWDLADRYNTLYYERDFKTSIGDTKTFIQNDYGYSIDQDAEVEQLIQDIYNNTKVKRDPVYAVKGYERNGRDDVCGTYVEANLSMQHLWFYKHGKLIIETDFVSGLPTPERETCTGVYAIPYKKSPEVLKGDTWEANVTYWMPFYNGQGLHDAPWRSAFGGTIYQGNGSHGCINLPADAARVIYENMEERIPIFIYK